MIANLKPYPAMKDSGVEWLGKVPEHWRVLPGRACYYEKKEPNFGLIEKTVLSLSYGRVGSDSTAGSVSHRGSLVY